MNVDASLRVGESTLPLSNEVKNLGCWFDAQLKMDCHINKVCEAAFFHLFNIRMIRKFLSSETTQTLVNAFVTSRLDFCNSLLYGLPACQLQKLQRVQNAAARLICNVGRFDHITPVLNDLHWLSIKYRINLRSYLLGYTHGAGVQSNLSLSHDYIRDRETIFHMQHSLMILYTLH